VGKIAPRRANGIAVPGNFADPTGAASQGSFAAGKKKRLQLGASR